MTAKDTVTPTPSHSESVWCPHCGEEFGQESYVETIRGLQAEISFKAGIREVVNYLVSDDNGLRIELKGDKWGKKLNEWLEA